MLSSSFVAILIFLTSYAHLVCSFHTPLSHPSVAFQQLIPLLTRRTTSSGSLPFDKVQDHHRSRNLQLNEIPPQRNDDGVIVSSNGDEYSKSLQRSLVWIFAAMSFATVIGATKGYTSAVEFSSGYLLELSLSIDNLFVFLVLFEYFKVPKNSQGKVLNYGIIGAVVLRGLFILAGSIAIGSFHQVLLLFAGILGYSSYKILFNKDDEDDESNTQVVNILKRVFSFSEDFDGDNFFTVENGKKLATPLLLCLLSIELSDIVFAFDSVPAIFGVTSDPFIVYTSNIFAICGLRSIFNVLSKAVSELEYLEKAVGIVLGIIATKMIGETFDIQVLDPIQSLFAVLIVLGGGVLLSVSKLKRENAL